LAREVRQPGEDLIRQLLPERPVATKTTIEALIEMELERRRTIEDLKTLTDEELREYQRKLRISQVK
jgi:hypothetical protein